MTVTARRIRVNGRVDAGRDVAPAAAGAARQVPAAPTWRTNVLFAAAWLALGVAALSLSALTPGIHATVGLSALAALFGLWVFWRHGHDAITPIGIYNFSFALFVGFAGLYQAFAMPSWTAPDAFLPAVACCYFLQVVTWLLFWTRQPPPPSDAVARVDHQTSGWAVTLGLSMLLAAVLVVQPPLQSGLKLLVDCIGFCGTLLVGVGLLRGPGERGWLSRGVIVCAALALYVSFLFTGFGRIVLGSLGFALLVVLSHRTTGRLVKAAVLLGTAPTLLLLAIVRVHKVQQLNPNVRENGLESVVSPLESFATLINLDNAGVLPHAGGHTFWSALVALVPREIWPEKPVGFGTEIVAFLHPQLMYTGHSDAALFFGEWLFNFGLPGLLLMVPVTGLLVRGLDHVLARTLRSPLDSTNALIRYTIVVVAGVGVVDLAWVGTFTYMARSGMRITLLAVVLLVVASAAAADRRAGGSRRPAHARRASTVPSPKD